MADSTAKNTETQNLSQSGEKSAVENKNIDAPEVFLSSAVGFRTASGNGSTSGKVIESYLFIKGPRTGPTLTILGPGSEILMQFRLGPDSLKPLADLLVGGQNVAGQMRIMASFCNSGICLEGENARIVLGCENTNGLLVVRNKRGDDQVYLEGVDANAALGGAGTDGELRVYTEIGYPNGSENDAALHFNAGTGNLALNGNGPDGGKMVLRYGGQDSIVVDGDRGEIAFVNADLAEEYPVSAGIIAEEGRVMVFNEEGKLEFCRHAYDSRVAGVVSGAGDFHPAIVLDRQRKATEKRVPLAMAGKVFCQVETLEEAIEPGDLLTTSAVTGFARKASNPERAFGATIGRALEAVPPGTKKMIPIRVSLI